MPLTMINLAEQLGYGMKAQSGGEEYTVIMHIGGQAALACKVADPMPAPIYLIAIDLKAEPPTQEGGNGGDTGDQKAE